MDSAMGSMSGNLMGELDTAAAFAGTITESFDINVVTYNVANVERDRPPFHLRSDRLLVQLRALDADCAELTGHGVDVFKLQEVKGAAGRKFVLDLCGSRYTPYWALCNNTPDDPTTQMCLVTCVDTTKLHVHEMRVIPMGGDVHKELTPTEYNRSVQAVRVSPRRLKMKEEPSTKIVSWQPFWMLNVHMSLKKLSNINEARWLAGEQPWLGAEPHEIAGDCNMFSDIDTVTGKGYSDEQQAAMETKYVDLFKADPREFGTGIRLVHSFVGLPDDKFKVADLRAPGPVDRPECRPDRVWIPKDDRRLTAKPLGVDTRKCFYDPTTAEARAELPGTGYKPGSNDHPSDHLPLVYTVKITAPVGV